MGADGSKPSKRDPVRLETLEGGSIWRVLLATPPGNILDEANSGILSEIFDRAGRNTSLKAIVVEGEGDNFSFGVSVQEHLPGRFESMLRNFHGVFHRILDASVFTIAAVRGQCLGGGLELAAFCHRVFASRDAKLGQPEIGLGVLPPVASVILAGRVGRSRAEDLCLTGRTLEAEEALRIGLVDEIAGDPGQAALEYARRHLMPRSASSLRLGLRAVRGGFAERFRRELAEVERLYIEELMSTADAVEGLEAFLDKREPSWSDS